MPSFDTFKKALEDVNSPEHDVLVRYVKSLIDISRKDMAPKYSQWDENDAVFRSKRKVDKEDRAAESRGQPKKMVVPLTFSQCLTFVAYNVQILTQNKRFYQLEPTGTEDNPLREPMELILERDLRKNTWSAHLVQFFLDIARFSLGVQEVCYAEDYRWLRVEKTETVQGAFGETTEDTTTAFQQVPVFVGNRVVPVSPYRWLPDTRLPLTRYQEGEFCGSEDMWSISSLQSDASCFNLNKIPKFTKDDFSKRKANTRIVEMSVRDSSGEASSESDMVKEGPVCVTKMVCDITPKNFKGKDDKPLLGSEPFKIRYIVWLANDKTIVRFDEAYYLHCQFPYIAGQFIPDQHQVVNEALADVCEALAELNTWKWNNHLTSLKASTDLKFIVDPAGIDMPSLEGRGPYIKLKKNASQTGVDRYIKQFTTVNTTENIVPDSQGIVEMLEKFTGYSSLMQGGTTPGRRSATADHAMIQGASARGKTTLSAIWDTSFERLGKQLIANNRQEMDFETFSRIIGKSLPVNPDIPALPDPMTGMPTPVKFTIEELFVLFKADPIAIATSEDFFVFDASNPSENAFLAQSLQEILMTILQNPEVAMTLGYGPSQIQALFNEIYTLRGVTQSRLPSPTPMPIQPPALGNVLPGPGSPEPASLAIV